MALRVHRPNPTVLALLALLAGSALAGVSSAGASDDFGHARFLAAESSVSIQRFEETEAEEAVPNLPVFTGDRIWSDETGRADIQLPDGSFLLIGPESRVDVEAIDDEGRRTTVRLSSGSVVVGRRDGSDAYSFLVVTEAGETTVESRGLVRVDVEGQDTRVAVLVGEAEVSSAERQREIGEGSESWMRDGFEPAPRREAEERDSLDAWAMERWERVDYRGESRRHLPDSLYAYEADFDLYGSWQEEPEVGAVWYPRVEVDWQPYRHGRWAWTPYGWSWVPVERWGWTVSHYGSWGFSFTRGWYWHPGRTWAPAHVVWAHNGHYVGWCARDRHGRPVHGRRDQRVHRGSFGQGWTFVGTGQMRHRDVRRSRIDHALLRSDSFRVTDSRVAPGRDGRRLVMRPSTDTTRAELRQPRPRAHAPAPRDHRTDSRSVRAGRRPSPFGDSGGRNAGVVDRARSRGASRLDRPGVLDSGQPSDAPERRGSLRTRPTERPARSDSRLGHASSDESRRRFVPRSEPDIRDSGSPGRRSEESSRRAEPRARAPRSSGSFSDRPRAERSEATSRTRSDRSESRLERRDSGSRSRSRSDAGGSAPRVERRESASRPRAGGGESAPRAERRDTSSRSRSDGGGASSRSERGGSSARSRSADDGSSSSREGGGGRRRGR